jgi:hypothetical protein
VKNSLDEHVVNRHRWTSAVWGIHEAGRFGTHGDFGPSICHETGENLCSPLFAIVGPGDIAAEKANALLVSYAPDMLRALLRWTDAPDDVRQMIGEILSEKE